MLFKKSILPWLLTLALPLSVQAKTIHIKDVGFATPEAMEYEADSDTYLVANINGSPFEKDDNGFISKLSPDGAVIELKWLDGASDDIALNAPKGMVAQGGKLYVADIDRLRVFDLSNKKQLEDIVFPGSRFINGVSPAPDGGLYVTDSGMAPGFKPAGTDAIYKVDVNGRITKIKSGKLGHPNGVYAHGDTLWMVTLGSGQLRTMTLDGTEKSRMTLPFNRLDGLIVTNDGRLITTSWKAKGVYEITPDDHLKLIVGELESPADLGYDTKRNRLLIPLFLKDEVIIFDLDE